MKNPAILNELPVAITGKPIPGAWRGILLIITILLNSLLVNAQVGIHTDFPDPSSAVEIYSLNKGLLIPRVTLSASLANPSPVTAPATGLLVFNSGANQALGFYYWNGSSWTAVGGGSSPQGDYWSLTGNAGTTVGTNFIGTLDAQDFAFYTDEAERMRITAAGNVVIGIDVPYHANDLFTVIGKPGLDYTINAYSPYVGVYSESGYAGFQSLGGKYGLRSELDSNGGFAVYARNLDAVGYGLVAAGSNQSPSYYGGRSAGISTLGNDGLHAYGKAVANGIGIMSAGNGLIPPALGQGAGGTFLGYWGLYGRSSIATGTGIIGLGNNLASSSFLVNGSGGAFTGNDGVFGKSILNTGTGVIGLGNNIAGAPSVVSTGTGGAFTGNDGVYAKGVNATTGIGVIGVGNNGGSYPATPSGCGGSFTGYHGAYGFSTTAGTGTGIIGVGNNIISPNLYSGGSGGAFTGLNAGAACYATSATAGIGVIGSGNNITPTLPTTGAGGAFNGLPVGVFTLGTDATAGIGIIGSGNNITSPAVPASGGCGGAFTGLTCGVYGNATNTGGLRYGGYFATTNGQYAYVGGRSNNTNQKITGTGAVSTIVKNNEGKLITLTCPEAPEVVFQDFGTGQLTDGKAHITIDPDLAININVSADHPLKVYITPEGDCNGVYVTNKSANGFDVIELQGGSSDVSFSWQIVATRANEEYALKDGSIERSDYSQRFAPAPGPLETVAQPVQTSEIKNSEPVEGKEMSSDKRFIKSSEREAEILKEAKDGFQIKIIDEPGE